MAAKSKKSNTTDKKKTETSSKAKQIADDDTIKEQLDRADIAVRSNQEQTLQLHTAWRAQLQRISLIVLFVIMSQMKVPGSACVAEIEVWNEEHQQNEDDMIQYSQAMYLCLKDSMVEVMSLVCGCLIFWMIRQTNSDDFSSTPFRMASSLLPMIAMMYMQNRTMGCMRHLKTTNNNTESVLEGDDVDEKSRRPFPVVIIYYVIVTLSLFAMKVQRTQGQQNIDKIQKLRKDLLEVKKKK